MVNDRHSGAGTSETCFFECAHRLVACSRDIHRPTFVTAAATKDAAKCMPNCRPCMWRHSLSGDGGTLCVVSGEPTSTPALPPPPPCTSLYEAWLSLGAVGLVAAAPATLPPGCTLPARRRANEVNDMPLVDAPAAASLAAAACCCWLGAASMLAEAAAGCASRWLCGGSWEPAIVRAVTRHTRSSKVHALS